MLLMMTDLQVLLNAYCPFSSTNFTAYSYESTSPEKLLERQLEKRCFEIHMKASLLSYICNQDLV